MKGKPSADATPQDKDTAISSPRRTKEVIRQFDFSLKKSLGQNFLTDQNILRKIISAADLDKDKGALEIGPGIGALTEPLAQTAGKVVAVEIDRRLLPILAETLKPYNNVEIVHGDILQIDLPHLWASHFREDQRVSVVANLPYYITTPIVMKLLEARLPLENIVVMVQKEVAERLTAAPGSKQYGSLSIAVQYYCEAEMVTIVPSSVFVPPPNVDSAVIRLKVRNRPPVEVEDEQHFFAVMQACFAQRRKTIANNLLHSSFFTKGDRELLENVLRSAGVEPGRRGETLSIAEYARLSNLMQSRREN